MSLGEFSEQLFILCIKLYRVTKNTPTQNSLFHIRKKVRTGERVCVCESVRVSVPTYSLVERGEREGEGEWLSRQPCVDLITPIKIIFHKGLSGKI